MKNIFLKTLYEKRWFAIGWSGGFVMFAALMVLFYPAMHMDGAIDALLVNMPSAFQGLVGNLSDLKEFSTYLASQLFDIRLPLIAGIMAIILGQSLSTAEEERGELRTLLSLPISRTRLLFEKWLALVVITGIAVAGLYAGIVVTIPFVEGATIDTYDLLSLLATTWLLMVTYGTIAFGVGSITGQKAAANTISILAIIGSFILSTFGQAVDWLEGYERLSLIHYFPATEIVKHGISWPNVAVLGGVTAVLLVVATVVFRTRDIK
jgi:ABC-2 type transport system permease protein